MPRRNYYKAVIFNLDGVLLDTERIICDAWKRAGGGKGYPLSEPLVRTLIGMPPADSREFVRKIYGNGFPFDKVYDRMLSLRAAYIENWGVRVKQGVHRLLEFLDQHRVPRAVITTTDFKSASTLLLGASLLPRFDVLLTGDDMQADLSALYLLATEKLNEGVDRCLVVEHSDAGVRAAHAMGTTVILIPNLQMPSAQTLLCVYQVHNTLEDVVEELPSLLAVPAEPPRWLHRAPETIPLLPAQERSLLPERSVVPQE